MNDLLRVHVFECERDLPPDASYAVERQARSRRLREHLLERLTAHVLEDRVVQLEGLASERRRQARGRVVEEPHDVRVRPPRLTEHPQHVRLALEARERLRRHCVRPQQLHNDEEPLGLVPARRVDPALTALADALAHVILRPARALQHPPGQQVPQGEQARIGGLHGVQPMLAHVRRRGA